MEDLISTQLQKAVITIVEFMRLDLANVNRAEAVCDWALPHVRSPEGCFYDRTCRYGTNQICCTWWSQACMLLAQARFAWAADTDRSSDSVQGIRGA